MTAVAVSTAPRVRVIAQSAGVRAGLVRAIEDAGIPVPADERRPQSFDVVVTTADDLAALASLPLSTGVVVIGGAPEAIAAALPGRGRAWGIVPEAAGPGALGAAIRAVAAGLRVVPASSPSPARLRSDTIAEPEDDVLFEEALTPREHEVLELAALGLSNHAIAARLDISDHTVKFHLASVYGKLGVRSRTAAVRRGLSRGLITI